MISKIRLLFHTIKYLKLKQILYQVYYRLKPGKALSYKERAHVTAKLYFNHTIPAPVIAKGKHKFIFLNIEHQFQGAVDWNYQGYGKLWNYNLQYFNFLQDPALSDADKSDYLDDINSWLKNGKLKLEPYPVSLRIMNTIRYASKEEIFLTADQTTALFAQLEYLNAHLEYHLLGNHLLENAFALLMGGYYFNNTSWKTKAKKILIIQLNEQILDDGGHFELSPMYHQIILFRVLELIEWYSRINDDKEFISFVRNIAVKMISWLNSITFENGDIPHLNDSAPGIALSTNDLLGYAVALDFNRIKPNRLSATGYRKFKNGNYECIVDAAPVGPDYQPGHSHADALSFILYYDKKPLFLEAGTSTYQIGERRNYERSTAAHNTVEVGAQNQSQVWGGFRVGRRARVRIIEDTSGIFTAEHDGYKHSFGVTHSRNFIFDANRIKITDTITNVRGKFLLHCAPEWNPKVINSNQVAIAPSIFITFEGAENIEIEQYNCANGYNRYLSAKVMVVTFTKQLQTIIDFKTEE